MVEVSAAQAAPIRPGRPTVSTAQAAARLGVHPDTIRRWVDSGQLAGFKIRPRDPKSQRRVFEAAVNEMLAERTSGGSTPTE